MFTILLVVLILMLLGALPTLPYSRSLGILPERRTGSNRYRRSRPASFRTVVILISPEAQPKKLRFG